MLDLQPDMSTVIVVSVLVGLFICLIIVIFGIKRRIEQPYLAPCKAFAGEVSEWFSDRFTKFTEYSKSAAFRSRDATLFPPVLENMDREIRGFDGGFYVIDEAVVVGQDPPAPVVVAQYTPRAVGCQDLRGHYVVNQRPYYEPCVRTGGPYVSDSMLSGNRPVHILVVGVSRFDDQGRFIGILDGVIDVHTAPFSAMAKDALRGNRSTRLVLLDREDVVIGSSHGVVDGKENVRYDPAVARLLAALERTRSDEYSDADGAIYHVDGTRFNRKSFHALCYKSP
jgi:hypothetical protein